MVEKWPAAEALASTPRAALAELTSAERTAWRGTSTSRSSGRIWPALRPRRLVTAVAASGRPVLAASPAPAPVAALSYGGVVRTVRMASSTRRWSALMTS